MEEEEGTGAGGAADAGRERSVDREVSETPDQAPGQFGYNLVYLDLVIFCNFNPATKGAIITICNPLTTF